MNTALPPNTDASQAAAWLRAWFGDEYPDEFVTLAMLRNMGGTNGRTIPRYVHLSVEDAIETIEQYGLDDLIYSSGQNWNLFVGVGVMGAPPLDKNGNPSRFKKGGRQAITRVPGVWVDLDVDKSGFFDSEEECLALLRSLPREVQPGIVVATGTGGIHAYWKTDRPLTMGEAEMLCTRWWVYLSSLTDKKIDKLTNADRIMKLPGTVRWPKSTADPTTLVRLLGASADWRIPVDRLMAVSEPAYTAYLQDIEERKRDIAKARAAAARMLGEMSDVDEVSGDDFYRKNKWASLMTLATIEDEFNETYTWDDILPPLGWTKLGEDSEGRDTWARPGLDEWELHKSAATDYDGSHVMSLFSDSEDTGLARLKDTGVALTKYRVYVECVWNGDEVGFVHRWMRGDR